MDISRKQAIIILDRSSNYAGEAWPDLCDDQGLYDGDKDTWPTFAEIMKALGVTEKEIEDANT